MVTQCAQAQCVPHRKLVEAEWSHDHRRVILTHVPLPPVPAYTRHDEGPVPMSADDTDIPLSRQGREALAEEAVLNAAMAFAGHVVQDASSRARNISGAGGEPRIAEAMYRQFLLETATLCLRRLGDAYAEEAARVAELGHPLDADAARLLRDAATRAAETMTELEGLGDLSLDILDRILDPRA
jgi:hypothetical protein